MKLSEWPSSLYQSLRLKYSSVNGLSRNVVKTIPVILSLTSIPSRLETLHLTIKSMMEQEFAPERILLWLHEDIADQLPESLLKLRGELFEIRFSPYTFSHRKLIHSIVDFPDKIIITCDDDVIYPVDTLKKLYEEHLNYPDAVIGNRCREITYKQDELLPYEQWPFITELPTNEKLVMPVGAFCVLYPPQSLDERVTNVDLFLKLAPKADDLWFKMMGLLKGNEAICNKTPPKMPIPIAGTQKIALKTINKKEDFNRVQWNQLNDYFKVDLTP